MPEQLTGFSEEITWQRRLPQVLHRLAVRFLEPVLIDWLQLVELALLELLAEQKQHFYLFFAFLRVRLS
jgi:hypothetical protein